MADEIKLGVDIEANLTKLDQMLNVAVQKTAVAGRAMQQSLSLSPGAGGGLGGDAVSQIASAKAGISSGSPVSFGGGLNARAGISIPAIGAGGTRNDSFTPIALANLGLSSMPGSQASFGGGLNARVGNGARPSYSMPYDLMAMYSGVNSNKSINGGPWVNGFINIASAAGMFYAASRGVSSLAQAENSWQGFALARDRRDIVGQYSAAADIQKQLWSVPVVGDLFKAYTKATYGIDYEVTAEAARKTRATQFENQMGFEGGGYFGTKRDLRNRFTVDVPAQVANMIMNGVPATVRTAFQKAETDKFKRENAEADLRRQLDLQTIRGQTASSIQRAMGLNVQADITDINTQFMTPIELAKRQGVNGAVDTERLSLLNRQKGAAIMGAILGGSGPGQSVDAFQAAGRVVSSGSSVGQEGVIAALNRIVENTDLTPTAVVGRN